MKAMMVVVPALALAACATAAERPAHLAGRCDAGPAQQFVGRGASPEIAAHARAAAGARDVRWLSPDTMVTQEYDSGRLNLSLDEARIIRAIHCG